ncbi:MAG TPA: hypothetical protein VFU47_16870 [Armatimonadota bacterium]|nr:hypothetical protein [Armatimonadota bacterium]
MNQSRLAWGLGALAALGTLLTAQPARAHSRCDRGGYVSRRYLRYEDDYCARPYRRAYYAPRRHYYRTRRAYYYDEAPRYYRVRRYYREPVYTRTVYTRSYACDDCGARFASAHWLRYHRRHTGCD